MCAASPTGPPDAEVDGQRVDLDTFMPLVLINPKVTPVGEDGDRSGRLPEFPGDVCADITRPESVDVKALNGEGKPIRFRCGGLLARAVQHEVDHLNGILFIDRMSAASKRELQPELDALQAQTRAQLQGSASGHRPAV